MSGVLQRAIFSSSLPNASNHRFSNRLYASHRFCLAARGDTVLGCTTGTLLGQQVCVDRLLTLEERLLGSELLRHDCLVAIHS